jgi:hypothetical protein
MANNYVDQLFALIEGIITSIHFQSYSPCDLFIILMIFTIDIAIFNPIRVVLCYYLKLLFAIL